MKKLIILFVVVLIISGCNLKKSQKENVEIINNEIEEVEKIEIEDDIIESLEESSRHQEWVEIDNNWKIIHNFVVYPEVKDKSSVVILIHENKWLTDWVRNMADQIASEWHIVIAPDLLSSFDKDRQRTSDFVNQDDATKAIYALDKDQVLSDLEAVANYAKTIDSFNWNIVSAWFCWWWSQSYSFATKSKDLKASLVFYGTAPEDESVYDDIDIPVYWFYGEDDSRVNATISQTEKYMTEKWKTYEYEIYEWAGHAFMRKGEESDADDIHIEARNNAYERMMKILNNYK